MRFCPISWRGTLVRESVESAFDDVAPVVDLNAAGARLRSRFSSGSLPDQTFQDGGLDAAVGQPGTVGH